MEFINIYIFEDDISQSTLYQKIVSKVYPNSEIKLISSYEDTLDILGKLRFPSILIIDIYLEGMNGLNLLKTILNKYPNELFYSIVITGSEDKDISLQSLRAGADEFLQKPISTDYLLLRLLNIKKFLELQINNQSKEKEIDELNQKYSNLRDQLIDLIKSFQNIRIPDAPKLTQRIKKAAIWIYRKISEEEVDTTNLEIAADLIFAGKLFLSEHQITKPVLVNGLVVGEEMAKVPDYSKTLLSKVPDFDEVINIVYHLYENFDGTGIPDKINGWKIPLESRILRAALDYEYQFEKNQGRESKTMEALFNESRRLYDFRVIAMLDQYLASQNINSKSSNQREVPVLISELRPGMILSRNIYTNSGLKLISMGTKLDPAAIDMLLNITQSDAIIGSIYIYDRATQSNY
ncbi:MAG: HD domain-containing phosphohydrolase [Chloroherpetonaceae bacterium]